MRYYCTYFDRNYLVKALALLHSLEKHSQEPYKVFIVCLDELTRTLLAKLSLPSIELIPLHEIEMNDDALLNARKTRSLVEYYWTLTPSVIYKIMDRHPEIDLMTYLDGDLFFYSSPDPIFLELGQSSILIHGHRFSPALKALESNGKYNVGLLCFRRDDRGMAALTWWRDRCNEWCFWRDEDGKMGDQKYLDDWPVRFQGVHVLQHTGAGVAPWNHDQYTFAGTPPFTTVDGEPLVFYHFHALTFVAPQIILPSKHAHYPITEDVLRHAYLPYAAGLYKAISEIRAVLPAFDAGLTGPISEDLAFLAQKGAWPSIDSSVPDYRKLDLDADWRCYWPPKGRQAVLLSADKAKAQAVRSSAMHSPQPDSAAVHLPEPANFMTGGADMLIEMWPQDRPVVSSDDLLKELSGRPITKEIRVLYIVGAHLFQEQALLSGLFPNLEKIYLFEPLKEMVQELQKLAQADNRLQVFPYAIADADGPIDFHVTDNNGESSSLLPMGKHREIFPWVHDAALVRVEGRTIQSVMCEHHLLPPDMLFLDVQGAEYRILSAITDDIFAATKLIYSEVSKEEIYKGARPLNDVIKLLTPNFLFAGFAPLMQISPTHGNALFVNRKKAELLAQPIKRGWVPAEAIALNDKGEALFSAGDISGAGEIFSALSSRFPGYPAAGNNLGVVYNNKGDPEKAFDCFLRVLKTDPQYESALLNAFDTIDLCSEPSYEKLEQCAFDYLDEHMYNQEVLSRLIPMQEKMYRGWMAKSLVLDGRYEKRAYSLTAVISTYKSGEFMEECLQALTGQTIGNELEIVIVDAASPQNERTVVEEYQKRFTNIRYVRLPERIGIYPAWNLGIFLSTGEFITPFSTNDVLRPDGYEIMLRHMRSHPNVSLVYGNTRLTSQPHQRWDKYVPLKNNADFVWPPFNYQQLLYNCMVGPHPIWRRQLHRDVGYFDPRYSAISDQDFWLRIGKFYTIEHIEEFTGLQWLSEDSLSGRPIGQMEIFEIERKHQKAWLKVHHAEYSKEQMNAVLQLFMWTLGRLLDGKELEKSVAFWDKHQAVFPQIPEVKQLADIVSRIRRSVAANRR